MGTDAYGAVGVVIGSHTLQLEGLQIVAFAFVCVCLAVGLFIAGIVIAFRPEREREADAG